MSRHDNRRRQRGVANSLLPIAIRALLTGGLILLATSIAGMAKLETMEQRINGLMTTIKRHNWGKSTPTLAQDLERLRALADQITQHPLGRLYMQATVADAYALENDYPSVGTRSPASPVDRQRNVLISEAYRDASRLTPLDPYLVARHARFVAATGSRDEFDALLLRAATLGPHDYNTLRQVIHLGISRWPTLSCSTRRAVLGALDRALVIDDGILARWNTDLGQRRLGETTEALVQRYGFDPAWARIVVQRCD